jgi:hypothetical protein
MKRTIAARELSFGPKLRARHCFVDRFRKDDVSPGCSVFVEVDNKPKLHTRLEGGERRCRGLAF